MTGRAGMTIIEIKRNSIRQLRNYGAWQYLMTLHLDLINLRRLLLAAESIASFRCYTAIRASRSMIIQIRVITAVHLRDSTTQVLT